MHTMIARKTGIFLCLVTIIGLLSVPIWPVSTKVSAQTNEEMFTQSQTQIVNAEGVRLELIQATQNPDNKTIRYDLKITSQIRSDRVQLRWEILGPAEIALGEKAVTMNLTVGGVYQQSITILPRGSGRVDLRAIVEAFQIDGTRLSTATQTMFFQPNGEILYPQTQQHSLAKIVYLIRSVSGTLLLALVLGAVVFQVGRSTARWLQQN